MKFVIDGRHIDGKKTGLSRYISLLTIELSKLVGAELVIVSNKSVVFDTKQLANKPEIYIDKSIWRKLPGSLWLAFRLPYLLRQMNCSYFLGTQHILPYFKPKSIRYGLIMHDLVYVYYPETMTKWNRFISSILIPHSLQIADVIYTVSKSTKQSIKEIYPYLRQPIKVTYPGFSFDNSVEANTNTGTTATRYLCVGSIEPRKNLNRLLDVYEFMLSKKPDISLTLVSGATWSSNEIASKIVSLGKNLTVYENISDKELRALYRTSDTLIFPSVYEGFGLPILESIGNCNVIANDIPVFRELEKKIDGISLLDFSNSTEFVADFILNCPSNIQARLKEGTSLNDFSWENNAHIVYSGLVA
ncbi:glycosyltransferase family 4 protein [Vibrio vulnificus]|nr:glycosyltransferase family 4 protein [Vibrio vulnificus]ELQ2465492.1 glycosyltransferase family 4 protein [Vibrio vulnificus]